MAVGTPGAIRAIPAQAGIFGQGVTYPLAFDAAGRLKLSAGPTLVQEQLLSLMQTYPGERPMEPDYGAAVGNFEPVDMQRAIDFIAQGISEHVPAVKDFRITSRLGNVPDATEITIRYVLVGDATPRTLTAPIFVGPALTNADGSAR